VRRRNDRPDRIAGSAPGNNSAPASAAISLAIGPVVELAVGHDMQAAVLILDRLITGAEVWELRSR
jgi:hypothetical protein